MRSAALIGGVVGLPVYLTGSSRGAGALDRGGGLRRGKRRKSEQGAEREPAGEAVERHEFSGSW